MKYTMNSKAYISLLLMGTALLMTTSCSEDRSSDSASQDNRISFTVNTEETVDITTRGSAVGKTVAFKGTQSNRPLYLSAEITARPAVTRGTRVEDAGHLSSFGVSAIKTNTNVSAEQFAAATPDFFYNLQATKNTNDVFEIAQDYYWPTSDEKLFFYAYTPYGNNKVQISDQSAGGAQKVMLTVDTDVENQVDLMTASAETTAFNSASGNQKKSSVGLNFKHELTAIRFVIGEQWLAGRIKSVGIYNVHGKGTMTIGADDASKWEWKNMDGTQTYSATDDFVLTVNKSGLNGTNNEQFIDDENLYFLMIPQSFDGNDDAYIEVKYQDLTYEYTVTAPLKGMAAWQRNTTVTYAISSHTLTKLKIGSISWPDESGANAWQGPKTGFVNGDAVGLYVVDTDGEHILHRNVRCSYNGSSWTVHHPTNDPVYKLPGRQYFFYYPYTADPDETKYPVAGQGTTNTAATAFFSTLINGWTPVATQNDATVFNNQDLQVGKGTDHATIASTINAMMAHQMNIAKLTLGSKEVDNRLTYKLSTDANYTWVHSGSLDNIVASSDFNTNIPYYIASTGERYFVFKPVNDTSLEPGTLLKGMRNNNVDWTCYLQTTSRGIRVEPTVYTNMPDTKSTETYTMALGDVFYSDGAISKAKSKYATTATRTPVGIVAYIGNDAYTEKNYGGGHALVLALADESSSTRVFLPKSNWMYDTPGITNVYDVATMKNASCGYENCNVYVSNLTSSNYPALYYGVYNNGVAYPTPKGPNGKSTGWFLPSCSQWYKIIASPGIGNFADASVTYNTYFDSGKTALTRINNALNAAGGTAIPSTKLYWTSNDKETNGADAINIIFNGSGILIGEGAGNYHAADCYVRSMLAF